MKIRLLLPVLAEDLNKVPAVVIFGSRQVGKTTLVKQLIKTIGKEKSCIYLDLESPSDRLKLSDAERFFQMNEDKTIVIDEAQLFPELFPILRSSIDRNRIPGRFVILGSSSPELMQKSSESLAGRVRYRELHPFNLEETGELGTNKLWFRGGYPESFLAENDQSALDWISDFIHSYINRDLLQMGISLAPLRIWRLLQMLAHQHGHLLNYSALAKSMEVSPPVISKAVNLLEEALLIRTIKPWHENIKKRLVKTPKIYLRDTGVLHHLLFLNSPTELLGHPQSGNSWEGFVIQQVCSALPRNIQLYFYRTHEGAEVDFLLVRGMEILCAAEIKLSNAPILKRGNHEAVADLQPKQKFVIVPQAEIFPIQHQWQVVGIFPFLKMVRTL